MLNEKSRETVGGSAPLDFGAKILDLAARLAEHSEAPDALTCTYYAPAHKKVAAQLRDWMRAAGLDAHIDAVGNVVGRYASAAASAKTLIVASHYDTVVNAGRFDGRLGVLTGLVIAEHLRSAGVKLPFNLDVIAFAEEEGVRFSAPYLGSRAIAGRFDESMLQWRDAGGVTLGAILKDDGVDFAAIRKLARRSDTLRGYLEVHIEQGPVLLEKNLPVGIVTSIAGTARFRVSVFGTAGHAGTVPMAARHDAAAAAAEIVLAVERRCSGVATLVGTVGQFEVPGGAVNVIPGRCEFSLDVRAADDATRDAAIDDIQVTIGQIAERRGVSARVTEVARNAAAACSPAMQAALAQAIAKQNIAPFYLPSGAGHDAEWFADLTDTAMLFVRCGNGGISHNPLETVTAQDVDVAARVLHDVIVGLA